MHAHALPTCMSLYVVMVPLGLRTTAVRGVFVVRVSISAGGGLAQTVSSSFFVFRESTCP